MTEKIMINVQVLDWNLLIEPIRGISYICIKITKRNNPNVLQVVPIIYVNVYLFSMCISEEEKT